MGSLLVITGPPGAGKSAIARVVAESAERSVLVEGDAFFGFLASGRIEPWLPESHDQNTVVTTAAASATGWFTQAGYVTIYDGVVGPWFLPTFFRATGLDQLDYAVLLPPVEQCVARVLARTGHGFTDEAATRKMHAEFDNAQIAAQYVLRNLPEAIEDTADLVLAAQANGTLSVSSAQLR